MSRSVNEAAGFRLAEQGDSTKPRPERAALAAGGIAALLAGACCLGPLLLVSVGVTGTWLAYLPRLEPYRPLFIGIAALALGFAWRRIYRPAAQCKPGEVCAIPQVKRGSRIGFWTVALLLLVMLLYPYLVPLFY